MFPAFAHCVYVFTVGWVMSRSPWAATTAEHVYAPQILNLEVKAVELLSPPRSPEGNVGQASPGARQCDITTSAPPEVTFLLVSGTAMGAGVCRFSSLLPYVGSVKGQLCSWTAVAACVISYRDTR